MTEFYTIEGGIASGKTTILQQLQGKIIRGKKVHIITEPVGAWCNTEHGNLVKDIHSR